MKLVYLAGPYRAPTAWEREQNIQRARQVAAELWRMGLAVVCPHSNSAHLDGAVEDAVFLRAGLVMLARCDALVLLPDWRDSAGSCEEYAHARRLGLPVFWWPEERERITRWAHGG